MKSNAATVSPIEPQKGTLMGIKVGIKVGIKEVQYECECGQCGRKMKDPQDAPIYVAVFDAYFCNAECWDKWRMFRAEKKERR